MPKSLEDHAQNFDLRHADFNDPDFLYELYSTCATEQPSRIPISHFFAHGDEGAWVAMTLRRVLRGPTGLGDLLEQVRIRVHSSPPGDIVILLDPPRQQQFRKVLNPYFSPGRMKKLQPQIRAETDALINEFIENGRGDLASGRLAAARHRVL